MKKSLKILRHNISILFVAACLVVFGAASQAGDPQMVYGTITLAATPTPANPFDVPTLLKQYDGAKTETTADYPGVDLGAKINAADAKCGNQKCVINVVGNDDFLTPAYPSEFRLIKFFPGVHKSRVIGNYGRVIYPKNNTILYASSWESIIDEADDVLDGKTPPAHSIIQPFAQTVVPYNLGESTANILKSESIHVIGLQFRGNRKNPSNDIGLAAVSLGNGDFSSVQDSFFNAVSGYGVQVGATPGDKVVGAILPDGRKIGYHARNCAILRNKFENLLTQNLGIITVNGLLVADNQFINPGRKQPNGSYSPFLTVLDVEPNGSEREIIVGVRIIRNLIDARNSSGSQYFGAIAFQITNPLIFNEKNEISDNPIIGVETGASQLSFGIYVTSYGTKDLLIARNSIKNSGQSGLSVSGRNIRVIDNVMVNVGGGGNPGMSVVHTVNSQIIGNSISLVPGGVPGSKEIWESFSNEKNLWERNRANAILHRAGSTVTNSTYRNNVLKYGIDQTANSKDNIFEGKK